MQIVIIGCLELKKPGRFLAVYETWKSLSHVQLFVSPWTIQSMEFSRPEDWSGQTFPRGSKPRSPALQLDSLPAEPQRKPWEGYEDTNVPAGWLAPPHQPHNLTTSAKRVCNQAISAFWPPFWHIWDSALVKKGWVSQLTCHYISNSDFIVKRYFAMTSWLRV